MKSEKLAIIMLGLVIALTGVILAFMICSSCSGFHVLTYPCNICGFGYPIFGLGLIISALAWGFYDE